MTASFTPEEISYLHEQPLGRLATVDPNGAPQNNPVGFWLDEQTGQILIGGHNLAASRKFRNITKNPNATLVVDDLVSTSPWTVRGIEIRGTAEALVDVDPPMPHFSRELIRLTPRWVGSWGIDEHVAGLSVRTA